MSKTHPYRIQVHCTPQMHQQINQFAELRGLSTSAAARVVMERGLAKTSDDFSDQFDRLFRLLNSLLHAAVVTRILSSEAAKMVGSEVTGEDLRERVGKMLKRYQSGGPQ